MLALFLGILLWTFLEYMIHRFLGHEVSGRNFFKVEHSMHHSKGNYFAPWWKKCLVAFPVALLSFGLARLFTSNGESLAFTLGFTGMYLTYEVVHYLIHIIPPITSYGRFLRKHHFSHHFQDPKSNHGVTSPLWDHVFGTFKKVQGVKVPRKLAARWLPEHLGDFPEYSWK